MFGFGRIRGRQPRDGAVSRSLVIRLPEADAVTARTVGADAFESMPGRAMKGYVLVPAADVADDAKIAAWVERGLATAAAMPAKK
jgi:hypothetical protein